MQGKENITVLGIESSCDETAAAVVETEAAALSERSEPRGPPHQGRPFSFAVRSNVVASQVDLHAQYGGVVPEVAAREHVVTILPVMEQALQDAFPRTHARDRLVPFRDAIDAIAVTAGPGLVTSLGVGVETARTLAYAWGKPVIAVNHIEGHVLSALLPQRGGNAKRKMPVPQSLSGVGQNAKLRFPCLALIVSGGHTELLLMEGWGKYALLGATRDDAAGEAFDKVAKLLELPYPGGPAVAKHAEKGNPVAFDFPRPMIDSGDFDFSFSGLKTAVRYALEHIEDRQSHIAHVCASFQQAAIDVLVAKTARAALAHRVKTVILGGGVAANRLLRMHLRDSLNPAIDVRIPAFEYCGDNAAMIAAAGGVRLLLGEETPWQELEVEGNWELGRNATCKMQSAPDRS